MKKNSDDAIIELERVRLGYGSKTILDNVDLKIERGSFLSIVGKSGTGKSTLLYMLGGFLRPQEGRYLFENRPVYGLGEIGLGGFRKKNIGYLFQDFRLLPFLTLEQNIRFPAFFSGDKIPREKVEEIMRTMGIENRRKAYPRDISGGEAQRTALARALILNPGVLLLDEPTGNLDEETEAGILEMLLALQKEKGLTLICITHSKTIVEKSDRVVKIEERKITDLAPNPKTKPPTNSRVAQKQKKGSQKEAHPKTTKGDQKNKNEDKKAKNKKSDNVNKNQKRDKLTTKTKPKGKQKRKADVLD